MSDSPTPKIIVLFSWHSQKNIALIEPLLRYLSDNCGHQVHVVTSDATGKIGLLKQGFRAYTVNELLVHYPTENVVEDTVPDGDHTPIDLSLNWLYTPTDPPQLPHPKRDQSIGYYHWKRSQLISAYRGFLNDLGANAVMTWNGALLVTGALADAAKELGLESFYLERGLLPRSLVFDPCGVNNESSLAGEGWLSNAPREPDEAEVNALKAYCKTIKTTGQSIVNTASQRQAESVYTELDLDPRRPVVLLPLQIESDSNIINNSPFFKSMERLIQDVRETLSDSDAQLIVRPHPEDRLRRDTIEALCEGPDVRCCWDLSLSSLLDVTQLVVVINSTVGLEALMQNIPVVALGRSIYDRKGFTLDLTEATALPPLIHRGLQSPLEPHAHFGFWHFLFTLITQSSFFFEDSRLPDGRESLNQTLANLPKRTPSNSHSLSPSVQMAETNDILKMLITGTSQDQSLVIGSLDTVFDELPEGVSVLSKRSAFTRLVASLLRRHDYVIWMEIPSNRLLRVLYILLRGDRKLVIG
ncbi:capsular polysaccharide biosynthesis protein [Tamilnaduibacter salinus]|uniref:Capsular polysaccharide biosynthesis protein n=1 Tax=Tamilnaduibacter salinus TaxID=1484056 RepID=A0A2U1CZT9_9GAMM|nr:hypothetical protein [Tamilnaduibacter salinus]PVY78310.1 capsular polysaccharide biosynthesis protein [Tamilnaduibacter salinus]